MGVYVEEFLMNFWELLIEVIKDFMEKMMWFFDKFFQFFDDIGVEQVFFFCGLKFIVVK